ncbi:MAG: glyoxalase [Sphingobacteriaceae bacterium]|nr:MAG: glyoxalase [Sphingobacteriaceae bacterium]
MLLQNKEELIGGVFITFAGNCKKALTFYQTCFGGTLHFETFDEDLGYKEKSVVRGTLVADNIVIHGSDLVHNEGRKIGNYVSVFLPFKNIEDRRDIIDKLSLGNKMLLDQDQTLIEITDAFDVRWVLGV